MTDLRETIARAKNRAADDFYFPTDPDFRRLLAAAEASLTARNAALEEAAGLVRQYRSNQITEGLHKLLSGIAADIEELKEPT